MSKKKLVEYSRGGIVYLFLIILSFVVITLWEPILGAGVTIFTILHELGHAIVAKHYNNFRCFFFDKNIGVRRKRVSKTFQELCYTKMSGLFFSLLILPIVFCMGASVRILIILFIASVAGASADIIQVIKAFKEWRK